MGLKGNSPRVKIHLKIQLNNSVNDKNVRKNIVLQSFIRRKFLETKNTAQITKINIKTSEIRRKFGDEQPNMLKMQYFSADLFVSFHFRFVHIKYRFSNR